MYSIKKAPLFKRNCLSIALALSVSAPSLAQASGALQKGQMPPPSVVLSTLEQKVIPDMIETHGRLSAFQSADVIPRVTGVIEMIHVKNGGRVAKGDVLITLDAEEYRIERDRIQAQLDAANAALKTDQYKFEQYATLIQQKAISKQDYHDVEAKYHASKASVRQLEAAMKKADLDVGYTIIRSPIDGYVQLPDLTEGALVNAYSQSVTRVVATDKLRFDFELSLNKIRDHQLQLGAKSDQRQHTHIQIENADGHISEGFIAGNDVELDTRRNTMRFRATINNQDSYLYPGEFSAAKIILPSEHASTLVPQKAISFNDKGQPGLWFVDSNQAVMWKPVTLNGKTSEGQYKVGLSDDSQGLERFVVEGTNKMRPGLTLPQ